jgi:threonine/homoserine/homoserine lactone efflux protein
MLRFILVGMGYALSAGLQPGPLQAFFLAGVAQNGWKKTLPAAAAPLISDGPIALIAILFLNFLPDNFRDYLQLAGGFLLLFFAWNAFQSWQQEKPIEEDSSSAPKTVLQAALVNILNPNPYLGWSLVMGPAVLSAWSEGLVFAISLLLSFYITMIGTSMAIIYLMGQALLLGDEARQKLTLISGLLLVGLGTYFVILAGSNLLGFS